MAWWNPSWLSFPSIDLPLPSGIQRRFISFILKRSLGHLLKPGQLDVQQIDSQIGSGYVQVRDLELDYDAINTLLAGLPVQLHDGSISSVTARIPWPNPLTANVGLSIQSLHLTFHLVPHEVEAPADLSANLADSVVSVAESFMHHELTPREEATLRESFHPDLAASSPNSHENIPGGLDQFVTAEGELPPDMDPAGVSIFATMIERLLSRFEFDAADTSITIVHPGHSSFTFKASEIRYGKDAADHPPPKGLEAGETRAVMMAGAEVTCCDLTPVGANSTASGAYSASLSTVESLSTTRPWNESTQSPIDPFLPSPPLPQSPSSGHSDSDIDDDTHLLMSQSLASLPPPPWPTSRPPRPSSPASTVASSMFQSAISTVQELPETVLEQVPETNHESTAHDRRSEGSPRGNETFAEERCQGPTDLPHEKLISFASDPIVVWLTTSALPTESVRPSPSSPPTSPSTDVPSNDPTHNDHPPAGQIRIAVSVPVIACALRAWQLCRIMDMVDTLGSGLSSRSSSPPKPRTQNTSSGFIVPTLSMLDQVEIDVHMRGLACLFLPARVLTDLQKKADAKSTNLDAFFAHPLLPPKLSSGYVRLLIDNVNASASIFTTVSRSSLSTKATSKARPADRQPKLSAAEMVYKTVTTALVSVADISIFAFYKPSTTAMGTDDVRDGSDLNVVPILITDPQLSSQYEPEHLLPPTLADGPNAGPKAPPELPVFDVVDWTSPSHHASQPKLSLWRVKAVRRHRHGHNPSVDATVVPSSPGKASPRPLQQALPSEPSTPAVTVKVALSSSTGGRVDEPLDSSSDVDVDFAPLHVLLDLGAILDNEQKTSHSQALAFLEELTSRKPERGQDARDPNDMDDSGDDSVDLDREDEEASTPPATPIRQRALRLQEQQKERERERRRLERLVLEDLDLSMDYRQHKHDPKLNTKTLQKRQSKSARDTIARISVRFPMIRTQIRCPPPLTRYPRSGALIIDIHKIALSSRPPPLTSQRIRFAGGDDTPSRPVEAGVTHLLSADLRRVVVSCTLAGSDTATSLLSLGSPAVAETTYRHTSGEDFGTSLLPRAATVSVTRNISSNRTKADAGPVAAVVVAIDIPSIHLVMSKPVFDGLQLWADDVSQFMERTSALASSERTSRDPSLIGSRFFVQPKRGSQDTDTTTASSVRETKPVTGETVFKVTVSEVFLRVLLDRETKGTLTSIKPLDILASDIDALLELKPEGKDETVFTLSVMDVLVVDRASSSPLPFLTLTAPRSLLTTSRPLIKLRFISLVVPESTAKESRVKLTLTGFTYNVMPDLQWLTALTIFAKPPPGAFESVVPSERTQVAVKVVDGSIRMFAPNHPGAIVVYLGELEFSTDLVGDSPETSFIISVSSLGAFLTDDNGATIRSPSNSRPSSTKGITHWRKLGYALICEISDLNLVIKRVEGSPSKSDVIVDGVTLRVHLCADTGAVLGAFFADLGSAFGSGAEKIEHSSGIEAKKPTDVSAKQGSASQMMSSIDHHAFHRVPEVGAAPDMIYDDLPSNLDYLDESFGAAAGLREYDDEDLEFDDQYVPDNVETDDPSVVSRVGGETIRVLQPQGIQLVANYFNTLPALTEEIPRLGEVRDGVRVHNGDVTLFLYEGYDWASTRRNIEHEVKEMKRRLAKIRQLVANGQTLDPEVDETSTLLYNSIYVGLGQDADEMEPKALIAAIDEELKDDIETESVSSWQSLQPPLPGKPTPPPVRLHGQRLTRARGPSIEFRLLGLGAEVEQYLPDEDFVSRTFATVKDVEILDHVKTSTWRKFLTALRSDSRGNVRETGSNMVRIELRTVRPVPGNPEEEARLKAKILPLRLHVDQDALDFLKKFFSFKDPNETPSSTPPKEIYLQRAEVFPVGLKLDYKPRRVDYRALRDGKTIELMNFFHFDGAEMTLRHITLSGVTGWPRFFDTLNDLWTPDVKATQLADVISGVAPIRSVVNVGSGVADLVLLPIAQYRKDGRVVRGVQKGTKAFVRSTAMEAVKLGARLATGTQVILEQTENVLGSQFNETVFAETVTSDSDEADPESDWNGDRTLADPISKYAEQPMDLTEGFQSAYASLRRNFNSAAQTILAVPMEVYERSGNEGPVRAVIRAVPIAVLKPMIGASEAVSKALLGLHNSMDPEVRYENEAKYKHR
ncbi:hypothetical protein BV25DRAFT_1821795 [Artomyces pyxidatus]|uniref:Uncharacterized protein n=1 Tax=Artomyces pyxidatus TaxID=48021 RepID=A0ACB8TAQ4_9AGAM|nr:hypothetical protein BV25DRAFT_1821795 [Artomyces pyxidatus]